MTHHPNTPASRNEEVWALRFPEDGGRLCLSTVFDTEEEAKEYASRCRSQPVGVVRLASRTEQAAPSVASGVERAGAVADELLAFVKKIANGEVQDHMFTSLEDEASSLAMKATAMLALARKP